MTATDDVTVRQQAQRRIRPTLTDIIVPGAIAYRSVQLADRLGTTTAEVPSGSTYTRAALAHLAIPVAIAFEVATWYGASLVLQDIAEGDYASAAKRTVGLAISRYATSRLIQGQRGT